MSRSYRHISQYANEIYKLREQGLNLNEIAKQLGFTHKQMRNFVYRENRNQRELASGIVIKPKGRPRKDNGELPPSIQQLSAYAQLQYKLSGKERYIKRLEMENELMRDFLSLTERK